MNITKEKLISKETLLKNVSINIKKICKEKNISMMKLAEEVDMSYEYLRQIVSPKEKNNYHFILFTNFQLY